MAPLLKLTNEGQKFCALKAVVVELPGRSIGCGHHDRSPIPQAGKKLSHHHGVCDVRDLEDKANTASASLQI